MTASRILAVFGSILVLIAIAGLAFFDQIQTSRNQNSKPEAVNFPSPTKVIISSVETGQNCQINVQLTTIESLSEDNSVEDVTIPTNFNPANSQCQEYMLKLVSPSQSFLAFEDLDNEGGDTLIKSWSLLDRQIREIGSVAPDSVIDMTFLPGDYLAILHGKNLSRGVQTIRIYDLNQPTNTFITLKLTDETQHYYYIASQDDQLRVFGPEGIEGSPIQSWSLNELLAQFEKNET